MVEPDTIKLLRECDAGIKMGISSIEEVLNMYTRRNCTNACLTVWKNMRSWKKKSRKY